MRLRRDLVVRERLPAEVVDQRNGLAGLRIAQSGEISIALRIAGHRGALRNALAVAKAFIVGEEEIFVLAGWGRRALRRTDSASEAPLWPRRKFRASR